MESSFTRSVKKTKPSRAKHNTQHHTTQHHTTHNTKHTNTKHKIQTQNTTQTQHKHKHKHKTQHKHKIKHETQHKHKTKHAKHNSNLSKGSVGMESSFTRSVKKTMPSIMMTAASNETPRSIHFMYFLDKFLLFEKDEISLLYYLC
jgi:hypothetical protein